jgi:uncharacterized protein YodC (DUF2158 family)
MADEVYGTAGRWVDGEFHPDGGEARRVLPDERERMMGTAPMADEVTVMNVGCDTPRPTAADGTEWFPHGDGTYHTKDGRLSWDGEGTPPSLSEQPAFTVGDVARLKSGGPAMTVIGETVGIFGSPSPKKWACQWFAGSAGKEEIRTAHLPPDALVKVDEKAEKLSATIKQAVELGCSEGLMREFLGLPTPTPLYSDAGCNHDGPRFNVGDTVSCVGAHFLMEIEELVGDMADCRWESGGRGRFPIRNLRHV